MTSLMTAAEDGVERAAKLARPVLPHLARLLLVATFMEDGVRMWTQFMEQREYLMILWGCGHFLASAFVTTNIICEIGAVAMVINRFLVNIACGILIFVVVLQTIAYGASDLVYLLRQLSLCGAVLLVAAEAWVENKSTVAGVPDAGEDKRPKMYLQLAGRVLLAFMFLTTLRFEANSLQIVYTIVTSVLMVLITIGYKTKLSASVLITLLFFHNLTHNCFWTVAARRPLRDFLRYDFFQTLSFMGGLLMVVVMGPGEVSMDEAKKKW
jgi:uncharacterized membrane protein YphA (DoxX/SURF4 family)